MKNQWLIIIHLLMHMNKEKKSRIYYKDKFNFHKFSRKKFHQNLTKYMSNNNIKIT